MKLLFCHLEHLDSLRLRRVRWVIVSGLREGRKGILVSCCLKYESWGGPEHVILYAMQCVFKF